MNKNYNNSIFNYESLNESVKRNPESPDKSRDSIINMSGGNMNR